MLKSAQAVWPAILLQGRRLSISILPATFGPWTSLPRALRPLDEIGRSCERAVRGRLSLAEKLDRCFPRERTLNMFSRLGHSTCSAGSATPLGRVVRLREYDV